jgi:hypothetical protein
MVFLSGGAEAYKRGVTISKDRSSDKQHKRRLMGGNGNADSSDDVKGCDYKIVTIRAADETAGAFFRGVDVFNPQPGEADHFTIPLYDKSDSVVVGQIEAFKTFLPKGNCHGSEIWSFDLVEEDGLKTFFSELHGSFSCYGAFSTISGGTGLLTCATGVVEFYDASAGYFDSERPADGEWVQWKLINCGKCAYKPDIF